MITQHWWHEAPVECGSLLPLWARLLAGAPGTGSELPARKAGASSRTPYPRDFDMTLNREKPVLTGILLPPYNCRCLYSASSGI
jgi:hypothetical protein